MTVDEFQTYWLESHANLVRSLRDAIPSMRRYVQSHTIVGPATDGLRASRGTGEPYDGVTEVWFDDAPVAAGTDASIEAGRRLLEDELSFIDMEGSSLFLTVGARDLLIGFTPPAGGRRTGSGPRGFRRRLWKSHCADRCPGWWGRRRRRGADRHLDQGVGAALGGGAVELVGQGIAHAPEPGACGRAVEVVQVATDAVELVGDDGAGDGVEGQAAGPAAVEGRRHPHLAPGVLLGGIGLAAIRVGQLPPVGMVVVNAS